MSVVYKACANSIVTLELLPDSLTNENRSDVTNSDFAKFRTNKAKVVSIVNPETKEWLAEDCSNHYPLFVYKVGEVIETKYDSDINKVCSWGIHYFKTYVAAFGWYHIGRPGTNGKQIVYHDDGQKAYEYNFKDGQPEGKQEVWYENGQKEYKQYYKDGQLEGKQFSWHENRQKRYEHNYKDGLKEGKQEEWYDNGQKRREESYKDGKADGEHEGWYKNGQKAYEDNYRNGSRTMKTGRYMKSNPINNLNEIYNK